MNEEIMTDHTRRTFLKQAAMGTAAVLAYPTSTVLGANDRIRVGMIGVGDRGNDLLGQIRAVPGVDLVAMAEIYKCLAAAKASNRVVQIGLQHQSSGAQSDAKQMIKDGWVGKVTQVESWMSRNTAHGKGQWVRPVPSDCTAQNVNWSAFLNGRPERPFDPFKLINWRLFWEFAGGNCAENMVHQIAWIMGALDLPLPSAAYMSGGVFSEKDGREVPDTIAVTLDFPNLVVTWQSTF